MAKDLGDAIGTALGKAAREAVESVASNARGRSNGMLSGGKGVAAGMGLAALAPVAAKGAGKLVKGAAGNGLGNVKDAVGSKLPSPGQGKSEGVPGVGKGRRMPIQQDIDIGVPLSTVYNQWTQFEDWPNFMHRLENVSQDDPTHLTFKTKIWGISKQFKAEIVEQRPDERIKWQVTEGVTHSGVVTFHELAPRLTRVELNIDVQPGSLIEKAARGMRHVKRAVRADLARFKAYVLMEEEESGAWRGRVEDGDVKRKTASRSRSASSGARRRSSSSRARSSSSNGSGSGSRSTQKKKSGSRR
jgi:uncharacterized membrane protein